MEELLPKVKDKMIGVKLTSKEFDDLKKLCEDQKVTVSRYVRFLIIQQLKS